MCSSKEERVAEPRVHIAYREQFNSSEAQMRSCVFDGQLFDSTSPAPAVAGSPQGPEVGLALAGRGGVGGGGGRGGG